MAEVVGLVASIFAVLELSVTVTKKCKTLIEAAQDAPRDLRNVLVEVASLTSALDNLKFLSELDFEFAEEISNQKGVTTAVEGCRDTLDDLATQLKGLSFSNYRTTSSGKRAKVKNAISWTWKENTTKKLLEDLLRYKSTITLSLLTHTSRETNKVKAAVDDIQEIVTDEQRHKICSWLEITNPTNIHNQARENYEQRTGEWMLRLPEWKSWLDSHASVRFLWIHGIPGAGKTVLASFLIGQCLHWIMQNNTANSSCVYYYCSYRNNQDESVPLLRWLVSQLSRKTKYVSKNVHDAYQNNHYPTLDILMDALHELLDRRQTVYLVVDGVDESKQRDKLSLLLKDLTEDPRFYKLQLLVTSRTYRDIQSIFSEISTSISMSIVEVDIDIRIYVAARLDKTFTGWRAEHKSNVLEELVQRAQGMFRLAVCHIDILLRRKTPTDMYNSLKRLPQTIEETYDMILLEIEQEDWPLARLILLWICANDKLPESLPITVNTLLHAMSRCTEDLYGTRVRYSKSDIQDICGCLVAFGRGRYDRFDRKIGTKCRDNIYFDSAMCAHYTVVEYLLSDRLVQNQGTSYFALHVTDITTTFPRTVLDAGKEIDFDALDEEYWASIAIYCADSIWLALYTYESDIAGNADLMAAWSQVFLEEAYYPLLSRAFSLCGFELFHTKMCWSRINWKVSDDLTNLQQRLIILIAALVFQGFTVLAQKLVTEYNPAILRIQLCFTVHNFAPHHQNPLLDEHETRQGSVIEAFFLCTIVSGIGEEALDVMDCLQQYADEARLLMVCIGFHFFHWQREEDKPYCFNEKCGRDEEELICMELQRLLRPENSDMRIFQMTPLQLAVHCWDYDIVRILLQNGAQPDGLGACHGDSIPVHLYRINHSWGRASPLHILRNAGFAPIGLGFLPEFLEDRQKDQSRIEELLLSYGATDFATALNI